HLRFPVTHRRAIRTPNLLERLFVEERRRLKIIPNAFGERAVLKLMFGALIRAAERWRSVKITEFERRQLAAVREEIKQEYETIAGLSASMEENCGIENANCGYRLFSSSSPTTVNCLLAERISIFGFNCLLL